MKKNKRSLEITTFLGQDSRIEGTIEFSGTIRLDGNVKGRILSNGGTVIIGERAKIEAELIVDEAIVHGEVTGTIDAKERIEVKPPGCVTGDITAPVISIGNGATFNGNCGMKSKRGEIKQFQESKKDAGKQQSRDYDKKKEKSIDKGSR